MNDFFEKTLETIIFQNKTNIHDRGFTKFYANAERQFLLPSGKKIDILTWEIVDGVLYAKVIELKKDILLEDAFWQVMEYVGEIIMIVGCYFQDFKVIPVLCGDNSTQRISSLMFLNSEIEVYEYIYTINGMKFHEQVKSYTPINFISTVEKKVGDISELRSCDIPFVKRLEGENAQDEQKILTAV